MHTIALALASALAVAQDTIVVRTNARADWRDVRIVKELTFGEVDGAEEYTFGRISGLAVATDGSMFVTDEQASTVREYSAAGKYVRSFGKRGSGPGELQGPDAVVLSGGRLFVRDTRSGRITVYSLKGGASQQWRYPNFSFWRFPLVAHPNGGVSTIVALSDGRGGVFPRILRYNGDGSPRDTLALPKLGPPAPELVAEVRSGISRYTVPFTPRDVWGYGPGEQLIGGHSARYSLFVTSGQKTLRIDHVAPRVAVTEGEKNVAREATLRGLRQMKPDYAWNGPDIPDTKPYFNSIVADGDGRIWVSTPAKTRQIAAARPGDLPNFVQPAVFDVFSLQGRYLAHVEFPEGFTWFTAHGDFVYGVQADELDVQHVVRYRLLHSR
jgi:hypothetical protein